MLVVSCGIFHRRRRKIVALIPLKLKARAGIAALTVALARYACVVATASESRLIRPSVYPLEGALSWLE
jgi:hypothetical protein